MKLATLKNGTRDGKLVVVSRDLTRFADASFLHAHLHVARRVYGRVGAARFSPVDLSGLLDTGLAIGALESVSRAVAGHRS